MMTVVCDFTNRQSRNCNPATNFLFRVKFTDYFAARTTIGPRHQLAAIFPPLPSLAI
jgi:hypothetical protein